MQKSKKIIHLYLTYIDIHYVKLYFIQINHKPALLCKVSWHQNYLVAILYRSWSKRGQFTLITDYIF